MWLIINARLNLYLRTVTTVSGGTSTYAAADTRVGPPLDHRSVRGAVIARRQSRAASGADIECTAAAGPMIASRYINQFSFVQCRPSR